MCSFDQLNCNVTLAALSYNFNFILFALLIIRSIYQHLIINFEMKSVAGQKSRAWVYLAYLKHDEYELLCSLAS